jgi:hypothetical protein
LLGGCEFSWLSLLATDRRGADELMKSLIWT